MAGEKQETVKLYLSNHCGPCQEVRGLIEAGKFNRDKVDVIDLAEESNFHFITDLNLSKVPTAMQGAEVCNLSIEDDVLLIDCPGDEKE